MLMTNNVVGDSNNDRVVSIVLTGVMVTVDSNSDYCDGELLTDTVGDVNGNN